MSPPTAPSALTPGAVLAGRYRLTRCLGEGGMGVVWEAKQVATDKAVAIKILKPRGDASGADGARFLREAKIAAGLSHRNIVQVFDYWDVEGDPVFLVMELLEGEPLSAMLERRGALAVDEALAIVLPIARAIAAAHALGVVHRDLKPDNVFLARDPAGNVEVKVVDFGLAKPATPDALATAVTVTGSLMGTPFYMSPEQVYGEKIIDGASDVWSLGVVMHECIAGARPFLGDNFGQIFKAITQTTPPPLRTIVSSAPPALEALVLRMLAADKSARPTMAVVVDELTALSLPLGATQLAPPAAKTQRLPSSVPPPPARTLVDASTSIHEPPRERARRPWVLAAVAGVALVVVGASSVVLVRASRPANVAHAPVPTASASASASASTAEPVASTAPVDTRATSDASSVAVPAAKPKPAGARRAGNKHADEKVETTDPLGAGRF